MKLRAWQSECAHLAVKHFRTEKNFLCLATPGAGKSIMAAEVAKRLLQDRQIDFVLCFAPSVSVIDGLKRSFSQHVDQRFDGQLGAIGGAYTYQGMLSLKEQIWTLLDTHRVLIVFDEIHHCSGGNSVSTNVWGQKILFKMQEKAAYTLALTGTPWRSDNNPIVLSRYSKPNGRIQCDYVYGLQKAIRDRVCRKPSIVLIDNERLRVTSESDSKDYSGLSDLFCSTDIRYQHLLNNEEALRFCLSLGCGQLDKVREKTPRAGGLVVTSSVAHAERIAKILRNLFKKTVMVVTYRNKHALDLIDCFRNGDQEWVVSVGMISEGTDIPRLQVCCHLSRITTELYFRQVLGRVLRTTIGDANTAWLYTFAEPMLSEFAQRVSEEVPTNKVVEYVTFQRSETAEEKLQGNEIITMDDQLINLSELDWSERDSSHDDYLSAGSVFDDVENSLECLGEFRQLLIDFFQNDLYLKPQD